MAMQMRKDNYVSTHGSEVLRAEVVHLLAMLIHKDLKGRRTIPGLNQDRADIIVAGVVLVAGGVLGTVYLIDKHLVSAIVHPWHELHEL
jgi:exopolyphosphatase/pppGpp-phosphohydrolase